MKYFLFILSLLIISCANKKNYTIQVSSSEENPSDSILQISDPGVRISVVWKSYEPKEGKVTLFDGANNPLWSGTYPTPWDEMVPATERTVQYEFKAEDKPGTWRLVMFLDGEEVVNHSFEVLPAGPDPEAYQALDCFLADGKVNVGNFYQVSPAENERLKQGTGVWYWIYAIEQLKVRATLCQAPEFNAYQVDEWEKWFQQLSGKKIRQTNPTVHERIAAVMPVYEEEFLFVNPDFVYWFSEYMIPDPQQSQVNGWLYQELYDRTILDAARKMALLYLYYNSLPEGGLDAQVQYAETMARKYVNQEEERVMERDEYVDVYQYLTEWHEAAANEWVATNIGKEIFGQAPYQYNSTDMGFWLRRGIDGSAIELWNALQEVLKKYDTAWHAEFIDDHWDP